MQTQNCIDQCMMQHNYDGSLAQKNSGLLRFRSAPSSLLSSNLVDGAEKSEIWTTRFCYDEANGMYGLENNDGSRSRGEITANSLFHPRQSAAPAITTATNGGACSVFSSMGSRSSPAAGLFGQTTDINDYSARRWIGRSYGVGDIEDDQDFSASSSRLIKKSIIDPSPDMSSSLGLFSQVAAVENDASRTNGLPSKAKQGSIGGHFNSGFLFGSSNDANSDFPENFGSGIKRELSNDWSMLVHSQEMEPENRPYTLSHHLSLPKFSPDMSGLERFLPAEDTVPCKLRAKRGCATHPRSIAERVRRTKISERIRKLQELVPNIEKQTNTADMLDLAVEHIKNLQKQYKNLSDGRAQCKCLVSRRTT